MRFGNVGLYCKGWYKYRHGGCKNMWMDMFHCINADGWLLWSKHDVVTWCMHRMDDMRKDDNFPNKHQLDFSYFWNEVNEIIRRDEWHYHEGIDFEDAIILHYRNIISNLEIKYFDKLLVKPNENVLPLCYGEAYYSDGKYGFNHEPSFTFAEMHCDVIEHINKSFVDFEDQDINPDEFEKIEGCIHDKNWEDVVVICGTDSLLDCEEVEVSGELLCNPENVKFTDEDFLDLNIYEHCINFNKEKTYLCRVKKIIDHYDFGDFTKYKLMSILKEI